MPDDREVYNYYKTMFSNFAGSPSQQSQILSSYYDYINPIERAKREQQSQLMSSLMGGGGQGQGNSYTDAYGQLVENRDGNQYVHLGQMQGDPYADLEITVDPTRRGGLGGTLDDISRSYSTAEKTLAGLPLRVGLGLAESIAGRPLVQDWSQTQQQLQNDQGLAGQAYRAVESSPFLSDLSKRFGDLGNSLLGREALPGYAAQAAAENQPRTLRGEEALRYLQSQGADPSAGFTINQGGGDIPTGYRQVAQPQSYGLLDDLASGLLSPIRNATTGIAEQGRAGGGNENYRPAYMSDAEWQQYAQNPLMKNLQNAAGVAAYGIPVGSGIMGLAKSGLASGALSGFGSQDLTQQGGQVDIGNILASGVLGLGSGAGLGLAGKGLSKVAQEGIGSVTPKVPGMGKISAGIESVANRAEGGSLVRRLGGKPPKSLGGVGLLKKAEQIGLQLDNPEALQASAQKILSDQAPVIGQITSDLAQKGVGIENARVVNFLQDQLDKAVTPSAKAPIQKVLEEVQLTLGDDTGTTLIDKLYKIKQEVGTQSYGKSLDPFEQSVAGVKADLYNHMNDLMDETLKGKGFNDFRKINNEITTATKSLTFANDRLANAYGKRPLGLYEVGSAGTGMMLTGGNPMGGALAVGAQKALQSQPVENAFVGGLRKAANVAGGIENLSLPNIPGVGGLTKGAAGKLANVAGNSAVQRGLPIGLVNAMNAGESQQGLPASGGAQAPMMQQGLPQTGLSASTQPTGVFAGMGEYGGRLQQALQLTMALTGEPNLNMAMKLAEEMGTGQGGKTLPAGQIEKLSATQDSLSKLDELEATINQFSNRFGPVQGGGLGDIVQGLGLDPQRAGIQSMVNSLAQIIGKALEGGKLTDSDIERYRKMLPSLQDPPANAIAKVNTLRNLISGSISAQQQGFGSLGYNIQPGLSGGGFNQADLLAMQ